MAWVRITVVQHRAPHAFDGLLGAVDCFDVLASARDVPKRGLLPVSGPIALLAHRIPAGFMLPVIITAADHQSLLDPDDLRADGEAKTDEAFGDSRGMERSVPNVRDCTGE